MNAIKRSLALLLVIAMMIPGFAFAEGEEILMISQEPEAIVLEETQPAEEEESSVSLAEMPMVFSGVEELPAEEIVIEEAVVEEEIPAEEEAPAEEEIPAEEAPVEEESTLQQVVMEQYNAACAHANFYEEYDYEDNCQLIAGSVTATTCSYTYDRVVCGTCMDCGEWLNIPAEQGLTAKNKPHQWSAYDKNGEMVISCWICDTLNTCKHDWFVEYEGRFDYEGRTKDNGNGTHDITFRGDRGYACKKCGANYWENDEEYTTIKGEAHEFRGAYCYYCGAANPCEHKNAIDQGGNDYANPIVHSTDKFTHTITAYTRTWYYCPDCGSEYDVLSSEPTTVNQTLPHEYDNGLCWICDYVNTCTHPGFEFQYEGYQPDWHDMNWLISTNLTTHTYWAVNYREGQCKECREYLYEYGTESIQYTEAHHYFGNENECSLCGYVPNCKHKNTVTSKEIYTYYNNWDVVKFNDQLHSVKCSKVTVETCVDCGYETENVTGTYTVLEPHGFYLTDTCDCGYKNTCKHKNTVADTWQNWVKATAVDSKTHKVTLQNVTSTFCEDCGATLSEKVTGSAGTDTANHTFGAANICMECNYVSTCAHSSTTKETDDYNYYEIISLEKHQKVSRKVTNVFCKSCKAHLYQRSYRTASIGSAASHTFEDGYCTACGLIEEGGACKHNWVNGVCTKCEEACTHSYANCVCVICGDENHVWVGCECTGCDLDKHLWNGCICAVCGDNKHVWDGCVCTACGEDKHTWNGCVCTSCGDDKHNWVDFTCTICGMVITTAQKVSVQGLDENNTITIGAKMTHQIVLDVQPAGAEFDAVYTTSNKKNVTVSADGVITGVAAGKSATITVSPADAESVVAPVSFTVKVTDAPKSVAMEAMEEACKVLCVGESIHLEAIVSPASALYTLTWSADSDAVTVDADGMVAAVKPGAAKITASTQNGKTASYSVTVVAMPESMDLGAASITMGVGMTRQIVPVFAPEGAGSEVYYTSEGECVTVDANGMITAVAEGTAVITASTHGLADQKITVTVVKAPETVSFARSTITASLYEKTLQLTPIIGEGEYASFTWTTSNKKIATVDANGLVTFLKKGNVSITAAAHNGAKAVCKIAIMPNEPTELTITPASIALAMGETAQLNFAFNKNAGSSVFTASESSIVAYKDGAIKAVQVGSDKLTFTAYNNVSAELNVTVEPAVNEIHMIVGGEIAGDMNLSVKQTVQLDVQRKDVSGNALSAGAYTFASSNEKVAVIGQDGNLTVKGAGEAEITLTAYNGISHSLKIFAVKAPSKVILSAAKQTLGVAESFELTASVKEEGTPVTYTASSSNAKVATVEEIENGRYIITAGEKPGSAKITVKSHNGKKATCTVTVKAAPEAVILDKTAVELALGETIRLTTKLEGKKAASGITWTSSNETVVKVEGGVLTTVGVGEATITAATYNDLTAVCTVKVWPAPASIEVTDAVILSVKQTYTPEIVLLDAEGNPTIGAVTVEGNKTYAPVKGNVITAKKATKADVPAVITVTTYNGLSDTCAVTVMDAPKSVKIVPNKVTMGECETIELAVSHLNADSPTTYEVSSNKPAVADVEMNENGAYILTAKAAGSATITVKTHNGKKATCKVTVKAAPTGITLNETADVVYKQTAQLTAKLEGEKAYSAITWTSSDEDIVTVENGVITGVAQGEAIITARTYNNFSAQCKVKVWMPAQSAEAKEENITISVKEKYTPEVELKDEFSNVTIGEYTLKSTNKGFVTVSGSTITGKKATKAGNPVEVQVILDGEVKDSIWVNVVK